MSRKKNPSDLVGKSFNRWHIDSYSHTANWNDYYNCTCSCGTRKIVNGRNLVEGKSKSCGCLVREKVHEKCFLDRTGKKYNNLTCIKWEYRGKNIFWLCKCDCGKEIWVKSGNLASGAVKSCGCIGKHTNQVHGMSHTRIHGIWSGIQQRCFNPKDDSYKYYGGRGIHICDEWRGTEGFVRFMEWSKKNGYTDELTIDRIDNNKDYSPENCRWTTQTVQMRNTRTNPHYTYNEKSYTMADLAEEFGIPYGTLWNRIHKLHWEIGEALQPKRKRGKKRKLQVNQSNYFDIETNLSYVDCSTYKNFIGTPGMKACECKALAIAKGEYVRPMTDALMVGSYVDAYFDNSLERFKDENPQIFTQKGELKSQYKQAEIMIERCKKDELFMKYMRGDTQQIFTSKINGVPVRIKIDSFDGHRITDLKTCKSISETYYAKDLGERLDFITYFGYVEQAYFYKKVMLNVTGKDYPFYIAAVSKDKEEGIAHPRIAVIQIPDRIIWDKGKEIEMNLPKVWKLLKGEMEPIPCGTCSWCADNLPIDRVISMDELLLEV